MRQTDRQARRPRPPAVVVGLTAVALLVAIAALLAARPKRDEDPLQQRVRAFAASIPGPGSDGYDVPTRDEAARLQAVYRALLHGRLGRATVLARPLRYAVRAEDHPTLGPLLLLSERRSADGSWPHAWGLYVHASRARTRATIEVAHPRADRLTERVGVEAFVAAGAANLLIAGSHRRANENGEAHVAHRSDSALQAVHQAVLQPEARVVQIHGFEAGDRPDRYGDAVVSSGDAPAGALARAMAHALRERGLRVCLYDGDPCSGLAATTNVQGRSARAAGAQFAHVELSARVRREPRLRRAAVDAIAGALRAHR